MDASHWVAQLRPRFAGRRWLIAMDVLQGATWQARWLREMGAPKAFVVAASQGTGPEPDPDHAEIARLGVTSGDMMSGIRAAEAALADVPAAVRARVDAWDPDGSARVLGTIFASGRPVAGRRYYGGRPEAWQALEDKTTVDALWDAIGVERAPAEVVPVQADALAEAAARLDVGHGTIWAGDNRLGFHGGATVLRWVRSADEIAPAAAFLASQCDRARVMPWLEGIPCSIHGMVFPDGAVAAFRPVEMVVLRVAGTGRLQYAGAASWWDPPAADREALRAVARRTGAYLQRSFGYRGVFTVDGVLTADGFRPTELNPRFGAAMGVLCRGVPELPILMLHFAAIEGEALDWRPAEIEALVVGSSDRQRAAGCHLVAPLRVGDTRSTRFRLADGVAEACEAGGDGGLVLGPAAGGGLLRVELDPERTPIGPSVAPRIAAAVALADQLWGTGVGALEPARDVRLS